jgi:YHS domain-containing protein
MAAVLVHPWGRAPGMGVAHTPFRYVLATITRRDVAMAMAKDPVCQMQVDEQEAVARGLTSEHNEQTYYFCAPGCKREFDRDPAHYTEQQPASG